MQRLAAAALALAVAAPVPTAAREVAGREFPETAELAGKALVLNGAGIRKKFIIKVYAAGLYVPATSSDPDALVALDAPKLVRMVFLRTVDREAVMDAFRTGLQHNSPGPGLPALLEALGRLADVVPAEFKEGDELTVTYVPGQGTVVKAASAVTIQGKELGDALFRNWLGPRPADSGLKEALLGR